MGDPRPARRSLVAGGVAVLALALAVAALWWVRSEPPTGPASRQDQVAARGAEVMPFDLESTTHRFTPTSWGGVQEVVADPGAPASEADLVRAHLEEEAHRFASGDFDDPAAIHGHDMPGLAELRDAGDRLTAVYEPMPGGARITYRTDDRAVLDALHQWFDAQVSDHGAHAEHGTHAEHGEHPPS